MKQLAALVTGALALLLAVSFHVPEAQAFNFNVDDYKAMVDADSPETIPPGTKITVNNWQKYKKFMQRWMVGAYSGEYKWHVGSGPEYTVEVGPTQHYVPPRQFLADTEKYGGQTTLVRMPWGGMKWKGYTAGIPFPNPTEPDLAYKMAYNTWANFRPKMMNFHAWNWIVDSYGNITNLESDDTFYRLMHLSDPPGGPLSLPFANGIYYVSRFLVIQPEQSRYTTEMTLRPDDPTRVEEIYVFLPSLRRSLRLSSSARCSPILGTDFIEDDNAWLPTNFKITLLGRKKLLADYQDPAKAFDRNSYIQPPTAFPGWPRYGTGKWELRKFNILDLTWLTSLGAYCYSDRIFYQDAEWFGTTPLEGYDRGGKFWKLVLVQQVPIEFRGQHTLIEIASIASVSGIDFQNSHITATAENPTSIDEDGAGWIAPPVGAEYRDMATMTTPGSLARIMK